MNEHSPLPWKEELGHIYGSDGFHACDPRCERADADSMATMDANAEFIVRAVNHHDELVAARMLLTFSDAPNFDCIRQSRAVLAKLEGGAA